MVNPQYSARIPQHLAVKVEKWQEETGTTKDADAVRELMRLGVEGAEEDHEQNEQPSPRARLAEQAGLAFAVSALVLVPLSLFQYPALFPVAVAYLALGFATLGYALRNRDALALPSLAAIREGVGR